MIILPCCANKRSDAGTSRRVSLSFSDQFSGYREALILSLTQRPHLWAYQQQRHLRAPEKNRDLHLRDTSAVLPVLDRYKGFLYAEISDGAKKKILDGSFPLVVLSALYGLISPNDEIPDYDLMMTDICNDTECLRAFPPGTARKVGALWKRAIRSGNISLGDSDFLIGFVSGEYNDVAYSIAGLRDHNKEYYQVVVKDGNSRETSRLRGVYLNSGLISLSKHSLHEWEALSKKPQFARLALKQWKTDFSRGCCSKL